MRLHVLISCAAVGALSLAPAAHLGARAQGAQSLADLKTRAERTDFRETSHYDDVVAFLDAVAKAAPKTVHLTTFGKTFEGRALPLAVVGAPDATPEAVKKTGKLRVYIQANIHAGEVEGKESAQILLRELAEGKHADWLQSMVLLVAPIYNADGNERFATNNRGRQNGPVAGQGQRPNAQGYDLNRDHMKLDSPEARSFVKLMTDYDPQVAMDLHTTNGSRHGYYLTYAPPLNPATDPSIIDLLRKDWLPSVTRTIKSKYNWDYYYYGNLEGARCRAGVAIVRRSAALQQQLRRPPQPHRDPQRGLRLRHVPGPHHGDQPLRRGSPELCQGPRRADQEADRRRRPPQRRRLQGGAARRDGEVSRRGRDPDRRRHRGEEPGLRRDDVPPLGRREARDDGRVRHVQGDRNRARALCLLHSRHSSPRRSTTSVRTASS